jgi:tRNA pseudouridine38-40 synthase
MQAALAALVGRHDFRAFEGTGSPRAHTIRTVMAADITRTNAYLRIAMQADGFLRYMARNIVGTLVEVGRGKMHPGEVANILASRERRRAGATAPAHGLCLVEVNY